MINTDAFLKLNLIPNYFEDEKLIACAEYAKKNAFSTIVVNMDSLELATEEGLAKAVDYLKMARSFFAKNGLVMDLSLDISKIVPKNNTKCLLVDEKGTKVKGTACILAADYVSAVIKVMKSLVRTVSPKTIWLKDFSLNLSGHNFGCLCDEHVSRISKKCGVKYDRETIADKLYRKRTDLTVKRAWMETNRESVSELCKKIRNDAISSSSKTEIAVVSANVLDRLVEFRDFNGVMKTISGAEKQTFGISLAGIGGYGSLEYFPRFMANAMTLKTLVSEKADTYVEVLGDEFDMDPKFAQFAFESSIPLCAKGYIFNAMDPHGNVVDNTGKGEKVSKLFPYFGAFSAMNLHYTDLKGLVVPIDEKTSYNKDFIEDFKDYYPGEFYFASYLENMGFPVVFSKKKVYKGETILLSSTNVLNFSDSELKLLFQDNIVVLDGSAVANIMDRGLNGLVNARAYREMIAGEDVQEYEQSDDDEEISGLRLRRAGVRTQCGNYVNIKYSGNTLRHTGVYDKDGNFLGAGITSARNFLVIPFTFDGYSDMGLYDEMRLYYIRKFVLRDKPEFIFSAMKGLNLFRFAKKSSDVLFVVNNTLSTMEGFELKTKKNVEDVKFLDRETGKKKKAKFEVVDGGIKINMKLEYLSTATIVIK